MKDGQNKLNLHLNLPTVILIAGQIIFIIFLIVSFSRLSQPEKITDDDPSQIPVVKISNFDSVAPENYSGYIQGVETTLFQLLLRNSPGRDVSKSIDAFVRDNSVKIKYFEDQNVNYFSAIIDIPDLEQSYWFYNEYSDNKNNLYIDYSKTYRIFCLDSSQETLYPNFNCKDDFGLAGKFELVSNLINYSRFDNFIPMYDAENGSNKIEISPYSFDDIDSDTKESYVQQTKEAISALGISPELFTYEVASPKNVRYYYPLP